MRWPEAAGAAPAWPFRHRSPLAHSPPAGAGSLAQRGARPRVLRGRGESWASARCPRGWSWNVAGERRREPGAHHWERARVSAGTGPSRARRWPVVTGLRLPGGDPPRWKEPGRKIPPPRKRPWASRARGLAAALRAPPGAPRPPPRQVRGAPGCRRRRRRSRTASREKGGLPHPGCRGEGAARPLPGIPGTVTAPSPPPLAASPGRRSRRSPP